MMFKRQFNPPADVPEYEGANQNSMTVEEFYQSTDFPQLDKHDRKSAMFTYYDLLDFAERYAEQDAFSVGYACACANMMRDHDQPTMVKDCLRANFLSVEKMYAIGVELSDIEILKPIVEEIENRRK
jgi:hypothetical protein